MASTVAVFAPPPDWPKIITRLGSPPKFTMFSFTHSRDAIRSITPVTPAYLKASGAPAPARSV